MAEISLGLYGPTYFGGFYPFLNWWKVADPHSITKAAGGSASGATVWSQGYLDSNGELVAAASGGAIAINDIVARIFFARPGVDQVTAGCNYAGEQFSIEWNGTATCSVNGVGSGGSQANVGSNRRDFTCGNPPSTMSVLFTITNANDPPTNIRIYQRRYVDNITAGEKLNPDWLAQLGQFDTLRMMDLMLTNNSTIVNFSDYATEAYSSWHGNSASFGPKRSIPLSILAEIANQTGCKIQVQIPHQAPDACVQSIAEFFRDNVATKVIYGYSNECWNSTFGGAGGQYAYCTAQGSTNWPGDVARLYKYYGYRSWQCMKIVRDVYNDRSRWEGAWETQTTNPILPYHVTGFNKAKLDAGSSLNTSDLFDGIYVTGYFGETFPSFLISNITQANPAVCTVNSSQHPLGHDYTNGQQIKVFCPAGSMTQLNDRYFTVANKTTFTFELQGENSTGHTAHSAAVSNYAVEAVIFEMMDEGHDYFNENMEQAILTGTSEHGYTLGTGNLPSTRDTHWPNNKTVADSHGLALRQYEGGCHFVGDIRLTANSGNTQFTTFVVNFGHSENCARVYDAFYQAFKYVGGEYPSKFVEAGTTGQHGSWAGMRFMPLTANGNTIDTENVIWKSVLRANRGKRRIRTV